MDTMIPINEQLLREVEVVAAKTGRTVPAVVEDALREAFSRRQPTAPRRPLEFPTFDSGGLMPGVDIDNSASLLDIMEEGDAPF